MSIMFKLFLLFATAFVVYKASEGLVYSLKQMTKDGLLGKFFMAAIFAGVATSLPEIFVAISSSFENVPSLSIGNALGSNIANLSFVVPLAIFLSGKVAKVNKENLSRKSALLILTSTVLPFMLVLDRVLSFFDGLFLAFMFFVYAVYLFGRKTEHGLFSFLRVIKKAFLQPHFWKGLFGVVLSLIVLVLGSDVIVRLSMSLAEDLGLSLFVAGLVFVALSTSLPELFVATAALAKEEEEIFFGDILGSLITNANLVIALSVLRRPVVFLDLSSYAVSVLILFLVLVLFYIFALTKRRIEKWEAAVLFSAYILFLILENIL